MAVDRPGMMFRWEKWETRSRRGGGRKDREQRLPYYQEYGVWEISLVGFSLCNLVAVFYLCFLAATWPVESGGR